MTSWLSGCPQLDKFVFIYVINKKEIKNREKANQFKYQPATEESRQVTKTQQANSCYHLEIINSAYHFKIICMHMVVHQLHRFCKVVTVGNNHLRTVFIYRNDNRLAVWKRVNLFAVDNSPYLQETQESIVLPGNNNMVFSRNILRFQLLCRCWENV